MDKKSWLDGLYYGLGRQATNFCLCYTYLDKNGDVKFSKWRSYIDCQADNTFIQKANQRTILRNEIVLDVDDGDYIGIILKLKSLGFTFYPFSTSEGRARHIHIFCRKMLYLKTAERIFYREALIKKFGCDLAYRNDKHLVPIEFTPHWKTGKVKELIKNV